MNRWLCVGIYILTITTILAEAQLVSKDKNSVQEKQSRGIWTDPSTGLIWAEKDNGRDISWKGAMHYCRALRLDGYSDWRLASLSELASIYDRASSTARLLDSSNGSSFPYHVKGNLFLTGDEWSSERRYDDRGHPNGYAWYFDFNEGRSNNDPIGWPYPFKGMRALCVHSPKR
jgi:hypothetical protein